MLIATITSLHNNCATFKGTVKKLTTAIHTSKFQGMKHIKLSLDSDKGDRSMPSSGIMNPCFHFQELYNVVRICSTVWHKTQNLSKT